MSYVALYRKFRPTEFQDVKGQEHIVTTLRNQIKADRVGHAYLFCGTRGTGKTTIAKLFARAVNCENPVDGSPCNECPTCKAILEGRSMNVVEIDAASNNGVDNIREIRDQVAYSPTEGKYRVYIIDEVHMLSAGAYNALLKTLEEPPSYVIFILATTEVHKIPVTVLSRCQRYDFRRISIDTIADRLRELADIEHIEVEEKALRYIARVADGSMRDALSLMDQCIAFYMGQKLTYDNALETLGAVDTQVFGRLFELIQQKDINAMMRMVEDIIHMGKELSNFVNEFTWYLRNLLLIKNSPDLEDVIDVSSENLEVLKQEAENIEFNDLIRYIRVFSDLSMEIKEARQKRVLFEVALIKLCKPQMEKDYESLVQRVSELEEKLESGNIMVATNQAQPQVQGTIASAAPAPTKKIAVSALPEDLQFIVANWKKICRNIDQPLGYYAGNSQISLRGDELVIVPVDSVSAGFLQREDSIKLILEGVERQINKSVRLSISKADMQSGYDGDLIDLEHIEGINMDIICED